MLLQTKPSALLSTHLAVIRSRYVLTLPLNLVRLPSLKNNKHLRTTGGVSPFVDDNIIPKPDRLASGGR